MQNEKLSKPSYTRLFPDIVEDIDNLIMSKIYRGRWTNRAHFVRCAVMSYIDRLEK